MAGVKVAALFCVFLVQRAACQGFSCQTDLCINMEDLVRALNNGPGIQGFIQPNQDCVCQPSISVNQCGCQQNIGVNQGCQPNIGVNQGCQPNIGVNQGCQPNIGVSQGCQSNIAVNQCGCQATSQLSIPQQAVNINALPVSLGQSCGCNRPGLSLGQPSISISQPAISIGQPCGCNQPTINQPCNQPLQSVPISIGNQLNNIPSPINLSNLQIGSVGCGCNQPITPRVQPVPIPIARQANCDCQQPRPCGNLPSGCVVPTALLQAPPYGIIFAGDNLLIDGAVQVCGNMPFETVVEFGGVLPSTGAGCVQYVCGDCCA